jgi:hypothetical protein
MYDNKTSQTAKKMRMAKAKGSLRLQEVLFFESGLSILSLDWVRWSPSTRAID